MDNSITLSFYQLLGIILSSTGLGVAALGVVSLTVLALHRLWGDMARRQARIVSDFADLTEAQTEATKQWVELASQLRRERDKADKKANTAHARAETQETVVRAVTEDNRLLRAELSIYKAREIKGGQDAEI